MTSPAASVRWLSASRSEVGNVRKLNEDACLDLPGSGLWVVADGMGGHHAGDYASRTIVETLAGVQPRLRPSEFIDDVEDRLIRVNHELHTRSTSGDTPTLTGSTVAALAAFDRFGICLWAGDSRVYRLRDGQFEQVTRDHSEVQEMIDRGQISTEEAATAANANVITRAVGGTSDLHVELALTELRDGDRYLLCSDGLFKEVPERDLAADLAGATTPREACDALLTRTLAGPCSDNVTAIVVMIVGGDEFDQTGQFSIAPPTA